MNYFEEALVFVSGGHSLLGVIARPAGVASRGVGVLIVVGGPQYRVGSHRQFVLLARDLAGAGFTAMRFDYHGMGDASGPLEDFESSQPDIQAAIEAMQARVPVLEGIILWGLCDGATAAAFQAAGNDRVVGLVLCNPWVRTEAGEAKALIRNYYARRLIDPGFWKKMIAGRFDVAKSMSDLMKVSRSSMRSEKKGSAADAPAAGGLPSRMGQALARSGKPCLFVLSGQDLVAAEFETALQNEPALKAIQSGSHIDTVRLAHANHTFSSRTLRGELGNVTIDWLRRFS